jgi:nitrogen fixation NifU-like protein
MDGDRIADIAFQGSGCAVSKSSASIMTTVIKGKTRQDAEEIFKKFHRLVTAPPGTPYDEKELGKLSVFSGVREYPIRIKCATLAWHALMAALENQGERVSTE